MSPPFISSGLALTSPSPCQRLRPLSYSKSHVILIAFAIDTPDSLDNVMEKVGADTNIFASSVLRELLLTWGLL